MTFAEYYEKIEPKLVRNFDLKKGIEIDGRFFDVYAEYHEIKGRTFLTKFDVLDQFEIFERIYISHFKECTLEIIQSCFDWMRKQADALKPSSYHLSTDFSAVLAFDRFDVSLAEYVRKFRFDRLYHYYFRGFSDVKLICVDLETGAVYTNKYGKRDRKLYSVG